MESVRVAVLLVALAGAAAVDAADRPPKPEEFTLGLVQRQLKAGLAQADVAERLGSPNLVTRDAAGREAWVYDKVATETDSSGRHVNLGFLGSAASASTFGLLGLSGGGHSEKSRSSQKTLTVVVRFATDGSVESFTFHQSRF
jgi:hypothetical protein